MDLHGRREGAGADHDELYDRKADPFQLNNIADQNPDKAREMLQQLKLVIGEIRTS